MKTKDFLHHVDHKKVVAAIQEAELKTSGEIRVFVSRKHIETPVTAAQHHFLRMGMTRTRQRNAVLIFVAPSSNRFAVVGDVGIHKRCGDEFWRKLADEMSEHFLRADFTLGLIQGIGKAGELLAEHFPRGPDDVNELPDEVEHD